jgi:hypothetical protein
MTTSDPNRKLWHAIVERAVTTAQQRGTPFTVEDVLDSIGVFSWVTYRQQALTFANKMLATHTKR